jgi:hypothetical protein
VIALGGHVHAAGRMTFGVRRGSSTENRTKH